MLVGRDWIRVFRRSAWLAGAGALLGSGVAYAASLTATSDTLTAAAVAAPRCSTAGTGAVEVLGANVITGVSLSNLDAACQGGTLRVTVNVGGGVTGSGSGTVPAGGGSMSVTISPSVAFVKNAQIDLVITGP